MSVTQVPLNPLKRGTLLKFWLGILALVGIALLLAWTGAGAMRGATTASGISIRTVEEGNGEPIRAMDGAIIEYEGRLVDGTVFDTTEGRGPAPMIPAQVIPGFGEALQLMREGGSYRIKIPSALAYGATGTPDGKIPPNSDLLFDVTIKQVVRDAGLMMGGQPPSDPGAQPGN
jgi:FKBP-type peptidyl-prolyl cis-trans isomerase FkpA